MFEFQNLFCVIENKLAPTTVFFRDDDVGWGGDRLPPLCRCFARHDIPLDLAVIPGAMDRAAATDIEVLCDEFGPLLHLHQHGYMHINHQQDGRKCEFGMDRSSADQTMDIAAGKERLANHFGSRIEPIFTPPWNRCTDATTDILLKQGFQAVSRTESPAGNVAPTLQEIPVTLDWLKKRDGQRLEKRSFMVYASQIFVEHDVVGVMLHHEHMDNDELSRFDSFLRQLSQSSNVVFKSMLDITTSMRCDGQIQ